MNYDPEGTASRLIESAVQQDGLPSRKKQWAAAILMFFVACICLLTVFAALPGCCTFNTGSLSGAKRQWRDHIASPGKMVQRVAAAESVYWRH
jgi:hypothetical protein